MFRLDPVPRPVIFPRGVSLLELERTIHERIDKLSLKVFDCFPDDMTTAAMMHANSLLRSSIIHHLHRIVVAPVVFLILGEAQFTQ